MIWPVTISRAVSVRATMSPKPTVLSVVTER